MCDAGPAEHSTGTNVSTGRCGVAGGCLGRPLGLLLLHGPCHRQSHRQSHLLSSVKILATGQSLFTQDPHHRGGQVQCVGRLRWDCEACRRGHVGTVATAEEEEEDNDNNCGHC